MGLARSDSLQRVLDEEQKRKMERLQHVGNMNYEAGPQPTLPFLQPPPRSTRRVKSIASQHKALVDAAKTERQDRPMTADELPVRKMHVVVPARPDEVDAQDEQQEKVATSNASMVSSSSSEKSQDRLMTWAGHERRRQRKREEMETMSREQSVAAAKLREARRQESLRALSTPAVTVSPSKEDDAVVKTPPMPTRPAPLSESILATLRNSGLTVISEVPSAVSTRPNSYHSGKDASLRNSFIGGKRLETEKETATRNLQEVSAAFEKLNPTPPATEAKESLTSPSKSSFFSFKKSSLSSIPEPPAAGEIKTVISAAKVNKIQHGHSRSHSGSSFLSSAAKLLNPRGHDLEKIPSNGPRPAQYVSATTLARVASTRSSQDKTRFSISSKTSSSQADSSSVAPCESVTSRSSDEIKTDAKQARHQSMMAALPTRQATDVVESEAMQHRKTKSDAKANAATVDFNALLADKKVMTLSEKRRLREQKRAELTVNVVSVKEVEAETAQSEEQEDRQMEDEPKTIAEMLSKHPLRSHPVSAAASNVSLPLEEEEPVVITRGRSGTVSTGGKTGDSSSTSSQREYDPYNSSPATTPEFSRPNSEKDIEEDLLVRNKRRAAVFSGAHFDSKAHLEPQHDDFGDASSSNYTSRASSPSPSHEDMHKTAMRWSYDELTRPGVSAEEPAEPEIPAVTPKQADFPEDVSPTHIASALAFIPDSAVTHSFHTLTSENLAQESLKSVSPPLPPNSRSTEYAPSTSPPPTSPLPRIPRGFRAPQAASRFDSPITSNQFASILSSASRPAPPPPSGSHDSYNNLSRWQHQHHQHVSNTSSAEHLRTGKPMQKSFVVCCGCEKYHDLPEQVYEALVHGSPAGSRSLASSPRMGGFESEGNKRQGGVVAADETKRAIVACEWCKHEMSTGCCAGYLAQMYLIKQAHGAF